MEVVVSMLAATSADEDCDDDEALAASALPELGEGRFFYDGD